MRFGNKGIAVLTCAALLAGIAAQTVMAAEDREKISKVYLKVESSIEVGSEDSDVTVTTENDNCSVEEVEVTNDNGEWKSGDEPRVKITLEANDDYYFSSTSSSAFKLSGDDADFVSASRKNSNSTLVVTIKLDALEGTLEIESAEWEGSNSPIATWEKADGAKTYQVRLYRGSSSVTDAVSTSNTYYDFSSYFTKTGDYSFKVRALDSKSKKGDWIESDSFYVDDDKLATIQSGSYTSSSTTGGAWLQDGTGWWYRNADGTYTRDGWQLINNYWYCFNSAGYMRTGWINSGSQWYYCDNTTGAMLTGTTTPDGYRVDANGVWVQ